MVGTIFHSIQEHHLLRRSIVANNHHCPIRAQYQLREQATSITMEQAIAEIKDKRSRQKARLTSSAKLIKTASSKQQATLYNTLNETYAEILNLHYHYCELVESDDKYSPHRTVGGLDLAAYLQSIDDTYTEACKSYATSLGLDIVKALKKADFYTNQISTENDVDALYNIQLADSHLSRCRELSTLSESVQVFDSELAENFDESVSKLDQAIYKSKKQCSFSKAVHFAEVPDNNPGTTQFDEASSNDRLPDVRPHFESTRVSLGTSDSDVADTPDSIPPNGPPVQTGISRNNESQGSGGSVSKTSSIGRISDLSIVAAYESGDAKPKAYPLAYSNDLPSSNSYGDSRGKSKFSKTPLPTFNGERNAWPEFRSVWLMHAQYEFRNDTERAWALKTCLRGKALEVVKAVLVTQSGAYLRMLKRLDDFFCDVSLNIQSVSDEFKKLKPVADNDLLGLVQLVNQVEMCYSQLGEVGQINSVVMPVVDQLVDLLPVTSRKDWMKIVKRASIEEQVHPFSLFMYFLEEERDTCMKLAERQKRRGDKSVKVHTTDSIYVYDSDDNSYCNATDSSMSDVSHESSRSVNHANQSEYLPHDKSVVLCIIHNKSHTTEECKQFLGMTVQDRLRIIRKQHACFRCFGKHELKDCKSQIACSNCNMVNHHLLLCKKQSESQVSMSSNHLGLSSNATGKHEACPAILCIHQVPVSGSDSDATVFFDNGSNGTFITHAGAKRLHATQLKPINVELTTTGNMESTHNTYLYEVYLQDTSQRAVRVLCLGLEEITGKVARLDLEVLRSLFPSIDPRLLQRNSDTVDILVGSDYCGLQPREEIASAGEHLKVLKGPFGICLNGSHPRLRLESSPHCQFTQVTGLDEVVSVRVKTNHVEFAQPSSHLITVEDSQRISKFIEGETLGTELSIKCGNCRCGKCPITGHTFSFREEQELQLIRQNLHYNPSMKAWVTKYPWIRDPCELPDNYHAAVATLRSTEKTLKKDDSWARIYSEQIADMVSRKVARKLTKEEIKSWKGPVFYISHLAVQNPKSSSTPVRIVFNSSQLFKGVSLNSFLAKGPDSYLNDLLGVLLRWREGSQVIVGDIKKMYNSIFIETTEQHCHRFLWRDIEERDPDIYIIQRVNMGDRPAAAISSEAIYKTADMCQDELPEVSELLKHSTYVDDIVHSVNSAEEARNLARQTTDVLKDAGFTIKHWLFSGESSPRVDLDTPPLTSDSSKLQILGITWCSITDNITFSPKINFSTKKKGIYTQPNLTKEQIPRLIPVNLTRRSVLEQTMRIYDPIGILSPFLLRAKILLRETWALKLGWDDAIPSNLRSQWIKLFKETFQLSQVEYDRCLTPSNATGDPILIILSDASDLAYGFSAYVRWELDDGNYWSRLVFAKCRIAPLTRLSTPQMELNGAVLSKRARKVVEQEMRLSFSRVYQLVDSETVLCMLNKVSTRFRLFEGVRVGEVQAATKGDMTSWFWVKGTKNTADWITRGKEVLELGPESEWWQGPSFLQQPEGLWGIKSYSECKESQEVEGLVAHISAVKSPTYLLDYSRYSKFMRYVWIIARICHAFQQKKLTAVTDTSSISPEVLRDAKRLIIKDVQQTLHSDLSSSTQGHKGKFSRLHPIQDSTDGVWVVGSRLIRNNPMATQPNILPALLPREHPVTSILLHEAHVKSGHRGRDVTLATFRQEYWVAQGSKLARKIVNDCQLCRIRNQKLLSQQMGKLPIERLTPSPPFDRVMVDFFGPYLVRGETQKRVSSKAYGVIFTDVCSRAVHIEAAFGYDTSSFLLALKRYTSIRGWPSTIFSDPGSQLIGAEKELISMWKSLDSETTYKTCTENGTQWIFGPADSAWHQGAVESLVKAAKRALKFSIGDQRLTASELLTVFTETANLLNERPIGILPSEDSELGVLTPNTLLLGRTSAGNPGSWQEDINLKGRVQYVGKIVQSFWSEWTKLYAPTLVYQSKWKQHSRNLRPGDVVSIADSNSLRGKYRVGIVREVYPGLDGLVRKVSVGYKNFKVGEKVGEYSGAKEVIVIRSVQRLALLVPVNEFPE